MADYDTLLSSAIQLPVDARIQLIEALWDTVPENAQPPLSAEWLAEIKRRSAEYDAGTVQTTTWEQVRADSLGRLKSST